MAAASRSDLYSEIPFMIIVNNQRRGRDRHQPFKGRSAVIGRNWSATP